MKKHIEEICVDNVQYLFNGSTMELFKVTNRKEADDYIANYDMSHIIEERKKEFINKIVLNISNKCNLKCIYCYAEGGTYNHNYNSEMSVDTLSTIIQSLVNKGIREINIVSFFGGEPLLNFEVIEYGLKEFSKYFKVHTFEVVTNGTMVNEKVLNVLKEYHVKLSISIDGPEDVTDKLRGFATFRLAKLALMLAKKMNYENLWVSATYTKIHEEMGYSRKDITDFFKQFDVKLSLSRVITDNPILIPQNKYTIDDLRNDIQESSTAIINNDTNRDINPYLYDVLMSLIYGTKSRAFCDELDSSISMTYDYNGDTYNCFRLWGDESYKAEEKSQTNPLIEKWNVKDGQNICKECWARNLCHLCSVAVLQGVASYGFDEERNLCSNRNAYKESLQEIISKIENGNFKKLIENFSNNFRIY